MIRPLRRRHFWMMAVTAAIVAPLFLAALAARPEPAVQRELPAALADPTTAGTGAAVTLPTTPPLHVRAAGSRAIELEADGPLEGAALLLYWVPDTEDEVTAGYLLGALRGGARQVLQLPAAAAGGPGQLLLYSLGHGEEVARAAWPAPGERP